MALNLSTKGKWFPLGEGVVDLSVESSFDVFKIYVCAYPGHVNERLHTVLPLEAGVLPGAMLCLLDSRERNFSL